MKLTTTLLLLWTTCTAQTIEGIHLNWFGLLQDISDQSNLKIDNTSVIFMSDGTSHEATEADSITWVWSRMHKTDTGWQRDVLDTAFRIQPSLFIPQLCDGVFVIEVEATAPDGRVWRCQGPCRIIWNIDVPDCPDLLPFTFYSENTWVTQDQNRRTFTSHLWYVGQDSVGELGDLNGDGQVNAADLLLFISKYGD